jgi:hypothetical protein
MPLCCLEDINTDCSKGEPHLFAVHLVVKQILKPLDFVMLTKYPTFLYSVALDLEDFLRCLPIT